MLASVLGRHPEIFTFHELHFFEELWMPGKADDIISAEAASRMLFSLYHRQRLGLHASIDERRFADEIASVLNGLEGESLSPHSLYEHFLNSETSLHGKTIPCEQTPRNLFYAREILALFPGARILNLIRDPRDVLLSQKNKWKRRSFGNFGVSSREVRRLKLNYHPYTVSRLWNSSVGFSKRFEGHDRFYSVLFEDLVLNPEPEVRKICDFLGVSFQKDILNIEHLSSSFQKSGTGEKGINKSALLRWKKGGLTHEEMYICQNLNHKLMENLGYEIVNDAKASMIKIVSLYIFLPLKIITALFLNFSRYRNLVESVFRRLGWGDTHRR